MKDFCPLSLLFGLGVPVKLTLQAGGGLIEIKLRPLKARTVIAVWGKGTIKEPLSVDGAEAMRAILQDGVVELRINGEVVENLLNLNPTVSSLIVDIILKLNGLIDPGASLVAEELRKIERDAYESLRDKDYTPQSPYFSIAQMAYSAFSSGARFSADCWLDEPYLLILAAMAVAKGEKNYYDDIARRTESQASKVTLPSSFPAAGGEPLRRRFKSPEEIKREMQRILKDVTGIDLGVKE